MIKNIIFDWSGTLSDDLIPVYKSSSHAFMYFGLKPLTLKEFRRQFILPYMDFYKKFKKGINKRECDKVFFEKFNSLRRPRAFSKAKKMLKFLIKKMIRMVVLSSHPQKEIEKELKLYGFNGYFIDVRGNVHNKTISINRILKRNKFNPRETAFVGDMVHDIEAGKKAKILTIAVTWGYQLKGALAKSNPNFLINEIHEIKKIIS